MPGAFGVADLLAPEAAPLASGGLVQEAAQWPTWPHRAHLVLFIMSLFFHRFGFGVFRNFEKAGFLVLPDFPFFDPLPGFPEDLPEPLPFFFDSGSLFLTNPRLSFFL